MAAHKCQVQSGTQTGTTWTTQMMGKGGSFFVDLSVVQGALHGYAFAATSSKSQAELD